MNPLVIRSDNTLRDEITMMIGRRRNLRQEIVDSIQYAKLIQDAILPNPAILKEWFTESFILYHPKNIISGDFYWFYKRRGKIFLVVAGSSVSGVPGASISIVGMNLLSKFIEDRGLTDPTSILEEMDFELNRILNHSLDANISTGLDFVSPVHSLSMALVCYDTERQRLTYAAADRSLYLMNKGELLELPGTTDPLGLRNFMTRSTFSRPIDVFPGDRLYLFTDGITSQEHFQSAEPFAIKRLQRHLLRSQRSNLEDQKKYIYQALIDWKSPKDYTDDILLLGVQF